MKLTTLAFYLLLSVLLTAPAPAAENAAPAAENAAPAAENAAPAAENDIEKRVEHGYADSGGVKIHYAAIGDKKNPLIVMIHGFPDFWYSWRDQMAALSS